MDRDGKIPIVSIVGRPNVGKSSLFNRICKKRQAVVFKKEGTTRDRIEQRITHGNKRFILVDTGGFLPYEKDEMSILVKSQIQKAIDSSDVLLFVCDGEKGLLPLDVELGYILRKSGKKIIPVVNKIDNENRKAVLYDFYELGLGEVFDISCIQNRGIERVLQELASVMPPYSDVGFENRCPIKIAIVGRPNVGKSSFLNKILNDERVLVHEKPGTTRDSVDTYFEKDGVLFLLIDTAGIRHRRKVKRAEEVYSMIRARQSIDQADLVLLLIDGLEGVTRDDIKIFDYITIKGKGLCFLVNKWDLVKGIDMSRYRQAVLKRIPEAKNFPVEFISAKTGRNVLKVFHTVGVIKTNLDLFITAHELKDFLKEIRPERIAIRRGQRPPRFYHMLEMKLAPKEFLVFVNDPKRVTELHTSYIENRLRERFPLEGVPLKLTYRRRA